MLSKSQARLFFLVGTAFFSIIFIALTIDSMSQLDERQNTDQLTPAVARGKEIWDSNNCMGCHTILGEGAYYAPELTKVVDRRGVAWLEIFLRDPAAMFPGQRRMVQYDFTDEQIADVIAFLDWIGNVDTNGFPPPPNMGPLAAGQGTVVVTAASTAPKPDYFTSVCSACHMVGGSGGTVGPALDGVGSRMSAEELHLWLADPGKVKPGTMMPNLNLPDETRTELVQWLVTLQ